MVLCAKVPRAKGEKVRRKLDSEGILDTDYAIESDGDFVYLPLKKRASSHELVDRKCKRKSKKPKSLKEALSGELSKKEMEELTTSFDIIGDIALLDIPESLEKKEKEIADALLSVHKNVKVVAKKESSVKNVFRVRRVNVIAGEKRTDTTYSESGCRFKLDISKVYFSPRLAFERERVAGRIKKGEKILALFAGVGPYPIIVSKKNPETEIVAIELNPAAVKYMEENIKLNKCKNIKAILGDVKEIVPKKYAGWADRVFMPLPKDAGEFLETAIIGTGKGGIVHYYSFAPIDDLYSQEIERIKNAAEELGRKAKVKGKKVVRPFAPKVSQIVIDFQVY